MGRLSCYSKYWVLFVLIVDNFLVNFMGFNAIYVLVFVLYLRIKLVTPYENLSIIHRQCGIY